jgi:hypothetical protein
MAEIYNLTTFPIEARKVTTEPWPIGLKHSFERIPKIGDAVTVKINKLGQGIVSGFFIEFDYMGVHVLLDPATEPDWHKKQCKGKSFEGQALVFGAEVEFL